ATGLPLLREELNRAGDARFLPRFLPLLGELAACCLEAGQIERGLEMIEDVLARCNDRQERWYLPELIRIKGELMLKSPRHSEHAEAHFREAIDIAVEQGARFWELRCAASLARFMMAAGQSAEALAILENVTGSFAEGSEIADMRSARELMAQLRN
ncbi:ATPase, partial [Bradyrhizobium sp. PRIMUS42]|nr:ATPase [Bradyrhizobium sp. PRIMUS42]